MIKEPIEFKSNLLTVKVFDNRIAMGDAAAKDVKDKIKELLAHQDNVNIIFAAAPSQNEFLEALAHSEGIDWASVNAFHMDEYLGLAPDAPQRFGIFLKKRLFGKVPFREVHYLDTDTYDLQETLNGYSELLKKYPVDIVCMGIGENAHIAFNDPHVANFEDTKNIKVVALEEVSRIQQVHDKCFNQLEDVPEKAITLTIPALMKARYIFCIVPGAHKAEAVFHTINDEIEEEYPSTILRKHPNAILYLDKESGGKLKG